MQAIGIGFAFILFLSVSSYVFGEAKSISSTAVVQNDESTTSSGSSEEFTVSSEKEDELLRYYNFNNHQDDIEGSGLEEQPDEKDDVFENCREPGYQKICSGHGSCVEGACWCHNSTVVSEQDPTYRYSGKYCEECPYCKGQRCNNFLPCITCKLIEGSSYCPTCPQHYTEVNTVIRNVTNDDKMCDMDYATGCYIQFKYYYRDNTVYLETANIAACYHGGVYMFYIYWALLFLLVLLIAVTPKMCFLSSQDRKLKTENNCMNTFRNRRYLYNEIRPLQMRETQL